MSTRDASTTTVLDVLSLAVTNRVQLFVEGEAIGYRAPPGAMTPELRTAIAGCKADLVAFLKKKSASFATSRIHRSGIPSSDPAPLSASQQQYWLLHHLVGPNSQYNVHLTLRRRGELDAAILRRALERIFERHASLRTTFPLIDGEPRAITAPTPEISLSHVDLRHYLPHVQEHAVRRMTQSEQLTPFDHEHGPLSRFLTITLASDDHLILWTQHHILTDGWSIQLFLRELNICYEAYSHQRDATLAPPQILYADYARWQAERHKYRDYQSSYAWWKEHLAGLPPLDIPRLRANPSRRAIDGDDVAFFLHRGLTSGIEALASAHKTTLYTVMLAAWSILLHRYSNQADFAVGTSAHGRTVPELHDIIGSFANIVPIRCDFSSNPSVGDVIARTHAALRASLDHEIPFIDVTKIATPSSSYEGLNPILQAHFVFEDTIPSVARDLQRAADEDRSWTPPFTFSPLERVTAAPPGITKFDLELILMKESDGIRGSVQFSSARFDAPLIERLVNHLNGIVQEMISKPDSPVSTLDLLSPTERQNIFANWNTTNLPIAAEDCVHHLFEAQVERSPNARAIVVGSESLTFRELDERANKLAHYLCEHCIAPDTLVGICMQGRRLASIVAMLAILKAGAAYVPIDTKQPASRVWSLLGGVGARIVITDRDMTTPSSAGRVVIIHIERDAEAIARQPGTPPRNRTRSDHLAYVLFTSGSTGTPKGVAVEHRQLANYVHAICKRMNLPDDCAYAHVSSFAADLGHTTLFPPLCFGGTLHFVGEGLVVDPEALGNYFDENPVDCLKIVPSHLSALLSGAAPARLLPRKLLVLGGEPFPFALLEQIRALAPSLRVLNHYGPTETTVGVLTFEATASRQGPYGSNVPLGRPLGNNHVYVVDANLRPVPIGVSGELLIAGAQVARGYLGQDVQTEKFVHNPFDTTTNSRAYRTGDRVRQLDSGEIDFIGRVDRQIKIRGFRVEPGEIEATLGTHPNVRASVVVPWTDGTIAPRLVAYVVSDKDSPAADELRTHLSRSLPDYMIPPQFTFLDAIPLGANGKIDYGKLPPPASTPQSTEEFPRGAAHTDIETAIARIWAELLGHEQLDIGQDFFAAGGNSLLLVSVHNRIQETLVCKMPLVELFKNRTIESLARKVTEIAEKANVHTESTPPRPHGSLLVQLRPGRIERPPMFLVHSAHGDGPAEYAYLAAHLSTDRPVYALRPPPNGLDRSIERLAARYLAEIRSRCTEGPYILGGSSFGGLVAYEMAQQLRHQGDEVAFLLLFDTIEPSQLPSALEDAAAGSPRSADYPSLRSRYKPKSYDGRIVLFRAEESEMRDFIPMHAGWAPWAAGGLTIIGTPGGHFTLAQEPYVQALAKHVTALLEHPAATS